MCEFVGCLCLCVRAGSTKQTSNPNENNVCGCCVWLCLSHFGVGYLWTRFHTLIAAACPAFVVSVDAVRSLLIHMFSFRAHNPRETMVYRAAAVRRNAIHCGAATRVDVVDGCARSRVCVCICARACVCVCVCVNYLNVSECSCLNVRSVCSSFGCVWYVYECVRADV